MMDIIQNKKIVIKKEEDILNVRHFIRKIATELGFNLLNITRLVTSASELTRNIIDYTKGGSLTVQVINSGQKTGIQLVFQDNGPGIKDIELVLKDGYASGDGLGMGLGGAKRLVDEFEIESDCNKGTRVRIVKWK